MSERFGDMNKMTTKEVWFSRHGLENVPSDWRKVSLGEIIALSQYGLNRDTGDEGPFPLLKMNNIVDGRLVLSSIDTCRVNKRDIDKYQLKSGDFLFNRTNSAGLVGKACVFAGSDICFAASYIVRLVFEQDINPEYINYWWQLDQARNRLAALSTIGVSQCNINPTELQKAFFILIPSRSEQDCIVRVLRQWDKCIDIAERLITAKQERRLWLMQGLLTGRRRFPQFISSTEKRKTYYGSLPADWGYSQIRTFAQEVSKKNTDDGKLPVLSCTKHQGLVDSLQYFSRQIFSEDLSTYKIVRRGQFAYATNHIDEGSIGYQDRYDKALISPMYTVFQSDGSIDDTFLYLVLKSETYRHIFAVNMSASVDRRGSLRWKEFSKIQVPLPSLEEQKAIVRIIETADRELNLLRSKVTALQKQKKGLMQQLLTGKRRVKVVK